jgi:hypothetical protein
MNIEGRQDYSRYTHSERYTRSKTEVKHMYVYKYCRKAGVNEERRNIYIYICKRMSKAYVCI